MEKLTEQIREAARVAEAESMEEGFNAMSWMDLTLEDYPETFDGLFDTPWHELSESQQEKRAKLIRSVL